MSAKRVGESLIDPDVRLPLFSRVGRLAERVVVQGPQGIVREALVVELDLLGADRDGVELDALDREGFRLIVGIAGPADPDATGVAQHRKQRADQAAGARRPVVVGPHDREPVRGDDERSVGPCGVHPDQPFDRVPGRGRRRDRSRPRCRPTTARGCRGPPGVNRPPTRASSRPGVRSGSRRRRATRRA